MDSALNSHGKLVHAQRASRGERYQCPECKVRVKFNPEGQRIAHFKHLPVSTLSPSDARRCERCSLYISDRGGTPQEPAPPKPRVRPPAKAVLAVGWKKTADSPERWSLYVSVPIPPLSVELVLVEGNINGEIWLPRRAVEKCRHIPVRVASKQYMCRYRQGATISGSYPVVQPSELLESDRANVFAAGTGGGVQLERGEPLVRGRCYFTLSKRPDVWRPPPGKTCRAIPGSKDCDPKGAWEGHLLYVPMRPDRDFAAWCLGVCKRNVVAPPADLELLYPPLIDTRPDGTFVVPYGEAVILALRGDWDEPEIEIWRDDSATSPTAERRSVSDGDLLAIRNLAEGLYSFYATESSRVIVRVEVAAGVEPAIPAFTIRTMDRATGAELHGNLHSADGAARWSGLMSGAEGWVGIEFPEGWPVRFSYRPRGENQDRSQTARTPGELARFVGECLAAEPLTTKVDAGVFGKAQWEAPKTALPLKQERREIPRRVRQRLEWLLSNAAGQSGTKALPVGISPIPGWEGRLAPNDFAMVAKFLKASRWPESLLAHARAVAKDLSEHLKM